MTALSRTLLAWISLGAWGWAVLVALLDRRHGRGLGSAPIRASDASVSVIVPARNEAGRLGPALATLEAQTHRVVEVIVVDDQSDDSTYTEAERHASDRIRVVRGAPLPSGWVGKSWAIHQGTELASGDWLLFTDADVTHAPDTVERAVALAEEHDLPGITVLPLLESVSPVERVVQPAAAVLIRSFVAPGPLVRLARSRTAIAAGGFILLRRDVYDTVGGHAAIRDRLVDDKALAEEVKRIARPLAIVDGEGRVRVRMYRGASEVWRGWRKNTSVGLAEGSPLVAAGAAVIGGAVAVWPWVVLVRGPRLIGLAALAAQTAARAEVASVAPTPRRYALTLPLGCLFLSATSLVSSVDRLRGRVEWRGRRYVTDERLSRAERGTPRA